MGVFFFIFRRCVAAADVVVPLMRGKLIVGMGSVETSSGSSLFGIRQGNISCESTFGLIVGSPRNKVIDLR